MPVSTVIRGRIFSGNGSKYGSECIGNIHRMAAPPKIEVADIVNIGSTTFLCSFMLDKGLCIRGPHTVDRLNRIE